MTWDEEDSSIPSHPLSSGPGPLSLPQAPHGHTHTATPSAGAKVPRTVRVLSPGSLTTEAEALGAGSQAAMTDSPRFLSRGAACPQAPGPLLSLTPLVGAPRLAHIPGGDATEPWAFREGCWRRRSPGPTRCQAVQWALLRSPAAKDTEIWRDRETGHLGQRSQQQGNGLESQRPSSTDSARGGRAFPAARNSTYEGSVPSQGRGPAPSHRTPHFQSSLHSCPHARARATLQTSTRPPASCSSPQSPPFSLEHHPGTLLARAHLPTSPA